MAIVVIVLVIGLLSLVVGLGGLIPIMGSNSSIIEGTIGLPVYSDDDDEEMMKPIDVKSVPLPANGSNFINAQYRNETIRLDISKYEECIGTLMSNMSQALTAGAPIHESWTYRAYDQCLERQSTAEEAKSLPLEIEVLYANDPNTVTQRLSMDGICAFDHNLEELEEELGTEFSSAVVDSLKSGNERVLNATVTALGGVLVPMEEQDCQVIREMLDKIEAAANNR